MGRLLPGVTGFATQVIPKAAPDTARSVDNHARSCTIAFFPGDPMTDKTFTAEQRAKLTQIVNEGMQVMHEVETLNGGLSDTIKKSSPMS